MNENENLLQQTVQKPYESSEWREYIKRQKLF